MFEAVDIVQKFQLITEYYTPKKVATINGTAVKLAKFRGPFTWHVHGESDEVFWVVKGELSILMRTPQGETPVVVKENGMLTVPKGTEHKPVAESEAWVVLLEPETMLNTGNVENEFTVRNIEHI